MVRSHVVGVGVFRVVIHRSSDRNLLGDIYIYTYIYIYFFICTCRLYRTDHTFVVHLDRERCLEQLPTRSVTRRTCSTFIHDEYMHL